MSSTEEIKLLNIHGICYSVISEPSESRFQLVKTATTTEDDRTVQNQPNLIVIDSVHSGKGRTAQNDLYTIVMKPIFEVVNIDHRLIKTTSRDTIASYASTLDISQSHTVLFLSGDTSISEFINNLPQGAPSANLSILSFPMGSGNAWASSLGIMCPVKTFGQFIRGEMSHSAFPLYKAVFPNGYSIVFFIILSMGFHANLVHACERPEYQRMGIEKFQLAGSVILKEYELDLKITVNSLAASYSYFALINTPNLEPAYRPSPESDPLKEELYLLGYSSGLSKDQFLTKVMKGYELGPSDKLPLDSDTIYVPFTKGFDVTLDFPLLESPRYKSEICCDGVLLNLQDLQADLEVSNKFSIEFLNHYSKFNIKAMSSN